MSLFTIQAFLKWQWPNVSLLILTLLAIFENLKLMSGFTAVRTESICWTDCTCSILSFPFVQWTLVVLLMKSQLVVLTCCSSHAGNSPCAQIPRSPNSLTEKNSGYQSNVCNRRGTAIKTCGREAWKRMRSEKLKLANGLSQVAPIPLAQRVLCFCDL